MYFPLPDGTEETFVNTALRVSTICLPERPQPSENCQTNIETFFGGFHRLTTEGS